MGDNVVLEPIYSFLTMISRRLIARPLFLRNDLQNAK